ncbi:MAG: hypothetical protein H6705_20985 [Myxococcales bacterium]|nr:hypothetical protein [Myxococcales bacterium]
MLQIDPHLWVLALPVAFVMGHLTLLPAAHPIRAHLDRLAALDGELTMRLVGTPLDRAWAAAWCLLTAALALTGLLSLAAWMGWVG